MYIFLIAIRILLPNQEEHGFKIVSRQQYSPDLCGVHAVEMIQRAETFIRFRVRADKLLFKATFTCEKLETSRI